MRKNQTEHDEWVGLMNKFITYDTSVVEEENPFDLEACFGKENFDMAIIYRTNNKQCFYCFSVG
jgi:hypothetical protein